jgi:ABC-type branched-subunit amino acid transport system substrate-binding protein
MDTKNIFSYIIKIMNPLQSNHGSPTQRGANGATSAARNPRRSDSRLKFSKRLVWIICILSALTGCDSPNESVAPKAINSGVTAQEILLGSSLALKGHANFLGTQTYRGAMSYLNHINAQGGVHGRTIQVVAYDDSYDPPMCLANTQKLIIDDQVFALFCYVGTPTTVKVLPMIEEARIPLLGMFTGANALREPFNRYLINVRASYYQETGAAVRHLIDDLGLHKIAVFYQYDAYGFDGLTGTELALRQFNLAPVAGGSYNRGTMDVQDGLNRIAASGAEAVVMIGTYDPCAKFIRLANEMGFRPVFYLVSFVGADELARRLENQRGITVIMSQVVPPPDRNDPSPLLTGEVGYVTLLKRFFPEDQPNFVGFEGFINARVLVEGLTRAGPDLTREGFIDAIESIRDMSLGLDINIAFSASDHQGLDRVYFTRLENGQFSLIKDWADIRGQLSASP